jgi:hypothetical protein
MDSFGISFIHNKTDMKILILYILNRLPRPIDMNTLAELALCDDGVNYFDFAEALSELEETQNVSKIDGKYLITSKGISNGSEIENTLPYTVRLAADRSTRRLSAVLKRSAMIEASHSEKDDGSCVVSLSLADGIGKIMRVELLTGSREQAKHMENKFRKNAEELYVKISGLLLE